ncbi:MAG TPA: dTDP-4-dehydrorhamnose 3,5-epimerase family protein [Chloroflexota bacterium]|nr:dTDP-4-dehydrorhamnose 3,5-epimerase family protein [Chloroflexota bacterium]
MTDTPHIGEEFVGAISVQDYSSRERIEGVDLIDLRLFSDEGGDFCELVRLDGSGRVEGLDDYRLQQASYSLLVPGAVKAWHLHLKQDDVWFVPPSDRLLVGLLDLRSDSGSYRRSMRFVLGGGRARLLFIPRGVAHGAANTTHRAVSLIYFVNAQFAPSDPDEHRLPFDHLGAEFWQITPG